MHADQPTYDHDGTTIRRLRTDGTYLPIGTMDDEHLASYVALALNAAATDPAESAADGSDTQTPANEAAQPGAASTAGAAGIPDAAYVAADTAALREFGAWETRPNRAAYIADLARRAARAAVEAAAPHIAFAAGVGLAQILDPSPTAASAPGIPDAAVDAYMAGEAGAWTQLTPDGMRAGMTAAVREGIRAGLAAAAPHLLATWAGYPHYGIGTDGHCFAHGPHPHAGMRCTACPECAPALARAAQPLLAAINAPGQPDTTHDGGVTPGTSPWGAC